MKSGCGPTFGCSSWIASVCPSLDGSTQPRSRAVPHALLAAGVELGGRAVSIEQPSAWRPSLIRNWPEQGVLFGSLDALVREHGDLLRPFFERRVVDPFKDKFSALQCGLLVAAARCCMCPRACGSKSRCIRCRRSRTAASTWARRW